MNKLTTIFGATLLTVTFNASAGDCPSLAGKYTIGKGDADFGSINEAVSALNCGGVSGNVSFLLEDGTYSEKVVMSTIHGANAFSTITFESASGVKENVIISANAEATVTLNGTSWVTFENLTIDHKENTYGNALKVDGKASNLNFKGIVFDGVEVTRTGTESAAVNFTNDAAKHDINIQDCEINNGSIGIAKGGVNSENPDTKTTITGTLFFNQYETALSLKNEEAPVMTNNVVNSLSNNQDFKAVNIENASDAVVISNNIINAPNGAYGVVLKDCKASATNLGQISNNSISVGGSKDAYGLYLTGNTDNQVFNFNRVKIQLEAGKGSSQAYYRNNGSGNNINMSNNIFYDLASGDYTIIGNTYQDLFNQLPGQGNSALSASANGVMFEKVSPIK